MLTASNDGVLRLWRASGDEQAFVPLAANIDDVSVTSRLVSVVADSGGTVWFYRFRLPGGQSLGRWRVGSGAKIAGILSDDGRLGVTYSPTSPVTGVPVVGPVRIWNAAQRRVVKTLPPAGVFAASLSPDDSRLFLQVKSNTFPPNGIGSGEIVNLASGHTVSLQTVTPCGSYPHGVTFSANDKRIAGAQLLRHRRRLERRHRTTCAPGGRARRGLEHRSHARRLAAARRILGFPGDDLERRERPPAAAS